MDVAIDQGVKSILSIGLTPSSVSFELGGHSFQFCSVESAHLQKVREIINRPIISTPDPIFQTIRKFEDLIALTASRKILDKGVFHVNGIKLTEDTSAYVDHVVCEIIDTLVPKIDPATYSQIISFKEDLRGVYKVTVDSELLLSYIFLRFQEHYESSEFMQKVFSREEFVDWYTEDNGDGVNFTYYRDWVGFNIPSESLRSFLDGDFQNIIPAESFLIQKLASVFETHKDRFYLIGLASTGDLWTYEHELAHALYSLNDNYRQEVDSLLALFPEELKVIYHQRLLAIGYTEEVLEDETHAYLIHLDESCRMFKLEKNGTDYQAIMPYHQKIAEIFKKFQKQEGLLPDLSSQEFPRFQ